MGINALIGMESIPSSARLTAISRRSSQVSPIPMKMCIRDSYCTEYGGFLNKKDRICTECRNRIGYRLGQDNVCKYLTLTPVSYTHLDVYKRQTLFIKDRVAGNYFSPTTFFVFKSLKHNTVPSGSSNCYICSFHTPFDKFHFPSIRCV